MKFIKESLIKAAPEKVFTLHELPDALERLTPPWEKVRIIKRADITQVGSRAIIETKLFGLLPVRWVAEHTVYEPPRKFEDVQISGPFHRWRHQHIVLPRADGAILRDEIDYELPLNFLTSWTAPLTVVPRLEKMFAYRHEVTRQWCELQVESSKAQGAGGKQPGANAEFTVGSEPSA